MELSEIYSNRSGAKPLPKISFEVFPPKNNDISELFEELRVLKKFNPVLVSLTYGANGAASRFSYEDLKNIRDLELEIMPHFTCVSAIRSEIENHITQIENLGIENILALRGDIPSYINLNELDFKYASELIEFIKEKTTLSIGAAGYPEGHTECKSIKEDLEYLKKKVDCGASAIFTQMFFDNDKFYKYIEKVRACGINIPVVSGIMPVRSFKQIEKMTSMARITLPDNFREKLEKYPDDAQKIGTEFAISQCRDLLEQGVDGLHFFTLNHSNQVSDIIGELL